MENKYYVYFLIDSRNDKVFYVGKGTRNRDISHINEAKKPPELWSNAIKCRRINAIHNSGATVIIKRIHDNLNEKEALLVESNYITQFGRLVDNSGYLTNIILDGSAHHCYKKVDQYTIDGVFVQTYDSVQEAADVAGVVDNTMSGVINNRSSNGKTLRTAGGFRWVHHGEQLLYYNRYEAIYESKKKRICQYDLMGNFIKTFDSAKQAFTELQVSQQGISKVCHHSLYTAGNYCWAFEGDIPRLPNLSNKKFGLKS